MQALKLDYVAHGRPAWAGAVLLALGLMGCAAAAWHHLELDRRIAFQESLLSGLRHRQHAPAPIPKEDPGKLSDEVGAANAVIDELNRPWNALFSAFESTPHDDVAILAIEPDAKKGVVRISGEAKSLESLLGYIGNLQKVPLFHDVTVQNHQVQDQVPEKPVRFMIQAQWGALH